MARGLGDANVTATVATANQTNAGNWTATFTPKDIGVSLQNFECYHIVIDGGPPGSTCTVYRGNRKYFSIFPGNNTDWDPNQPLKLESGDTVSFQWNTGAGTSAPDVWMYFQEPELL